MWRCSCDRCTGKATPDRGPDPNRYCEDCGEAKVKTGYGYACPSCNPPPEEGF